MRSNKTREEQALALQKQRAAQQQQLSPQDQAALIQAQAAQKNVQLREAEYQLAASRIEIERDRLRLEANEYNVKAAQLQAAGVEVPYFYTTDQQRAAASAAQRAAEEAAARQPKTERLEDLPLRDKFRVRINQAGHVVDVTKEQVDRAGKTVAEGINAAKRAWNSFNTRRQQNPSAPAPQVHHPLAIAPARRGAETIELPERDAIEGQFTVMDTDPNDLLRELLGQ